MKRILLLILAALWLVPGVALAHSTMDNAVPAQNTTVSASPEMIQLTFNTKIERLSNFKLLNAAGEQVEVDKVVVNGDTMSKKVPAVLPNGIYTVVWTIIGGDGHSVEGDYSFTVDAPVQAIEPSLEPEPSEVAPETSLEPTPEATMDTNNASNSDLKDNTSDKADKDKANYTPIIIIGAIIGAAVILLTLRRRHT